jgi:hypothetical protein
MSIVRLWTKDNPYRKSPRLEGWLAKKEEVVDFIINKGHTQEEASKEFHLKPLTIAKMIYYENGWGKNPFRRKVSHFKKKNKYNSQYNSLKNKVLG